MNLGLKTDAGSGKGIFMGGLQLPKNGMMKSTQERQLRKEKAYRQVEFWENQKENLKSMECTTLEEIERKLELFHTYEDQAKAAKMAYNNEQMFHALDEAFEQGEKNAKAAEKTKPKTEEERKEEMAEEALGIDEEKGALSEAMDEVMEEALKQLEKTDDMLKEEAALPKEHKALEAGAAAEEEALLPKEAAEELEKRLYGGFDVRV